MVSLAFTLATEHRADPEPPREGGLREKRIGSTGGAASGWVAAFEAGSAGPGPRLPASKHFPAQLVRSLVPVRSGAGGHLERDKQIDRTVHFALYNRLHFIQLPGRNLHDQFVVHLKQHA